MWIKRLKYALFLSCLVQRPLVKGTEHSIKLHVVAFPFKEDHRVGHGWDGSLKIFTFLSIQWSIKHVFRIDRSLHLKLLKQGPFLTNYGFWPYFEFAQGHCNCKNQPCSCICHEYEDIFSSFCKNWLSWLPTSRNCQFGLFRPFLQMSLPSVGSHLLSAP